VIRSDDKNASVNKIFEIFNGFEDSEQLSVVRRVIFLRVA